MKDLISIVLPVYNGAKYLRESIDSVISQTYTNWELLILDDCSTDDTAKIANEYVEKDERIHYFLNEKNLKIWRLVFIQMHYNDKIRSFFENEILVKPLIFWKEFFTILKDNGVIRNDTNPELLAKEYYSFPIYLLLEITAKYDDIPQSSLDNFFKQSEEHAKFLLDCIKVKT